MKFKAVWEDSSDTEEEREVEDNPLLDIIPPGANTSLNRSTRSIGGRSTGRKSIGKGKGKEKRGFGGHGSSDAEDGVSGYDDDEEDREDGEEDGMDVMMERRSAKALIPTSQGDYVHPHEAREGAGQGISSRGRSTRGSSPAGMDRFSGRATFNDSHDREEEDEDEEDEEDEERKKENVPWPAKIGIEPHRVHVMQQSFFHTNSGTNANANARVASSSGFLQAQTSGGATTGKRAREPFAPLIEERPQQQGQSQSVRPFSPLPSLFLY